MAFQRIIEAILDGKEFTVYGDGTQTRDFTYVLDIVDGLIVAAGQGVIGNIYNLGGSIVASINNALQFVQEIARKSSRLSIKKIKKEM